MSTKDLIDIGKKRRDQCRERSTAALVSVRESEPSAHVHAIHDIGLNLS